MATCKVADERLALLEVNMAYGSMLHTIVGAALDSNNPYGGNGLLANRLRLPLNICEEVRQAWQQEKPLVVRISTPTQLSDVLERDDYIEFARQLKAHGCDMIAVAIHPSAGRDGLLLQRLLSDRIRSEVSLPILTIGGLTTLDEANTLILSGRADLCMLEP
jgi:anthraniloyl-CoA monooxygenase